MTTPPDPDDVGPLLDPTGGPDEPTPEFTPTPDGEEPADWVAGVDDGETDATPRPEARSRGRRVYARPPDEAFDTPSALEAWIDQFLEEALRPDEDDAP